MRLEWSRLLWAALVVTLLGAASPSAATAGPRERLPLRLSATAVDYSGIGAAMTGELQITIERWSTPKELRKLVATLQENGTQALLDAIQSLKPRAGFIRSAQSLGWDIHFACETRGRSGARQIVIVTDRPLSVAELQGDTRSSQYDFMLAEIHIGPEGKGEGRLAPEARISYFEPTKTIEVEDFDQEPVRLENVRIAGG